MTSGLDYGIAAGAGLVAGGINAMAGGGSLVSFPVLHFIGLSSIDANVTNIVGLTPGYAAGSYGQRADLEGQLHRVPGLGIAAGLGALTGSILLVTVAVHSFTTVVPYLILLACGALACQDRVRRLVEGRRAPAGSSDSSEAPPAVGRGHLQRAVVYVTCIYGGFFGAGLGIMLLAVLGFFSAESLVRINALKQVLSLIVSVCAAAVLSFTGHMAWGLAGALAGACVIGGFIGGRLVRHVNPTVLRVLVVAYGVAVAVHYWA